MDQKAMFTKDMEMFQEEISKLLDEQKDVRKLRMGLYLEGLKYFLIAQDTLRNMGLDARQQTIKLSESLNLILQAINNIEKKG